MSFGRVGVLVFSCAITGCAITGARQAPPAGPIAADPGGAAGYQHGMERSQFIVGDAPRSANQFGFTKLVGSEGSFAVDMTNGAVIAIPGAHSADMQKDVWYTQGSAKHNDAVRAYFIAAGIPPDQIRGVHALTSL